MSDNTLFLNMLVSGYPEDTPDPFFARYLQSLSAQGRYNVVIRKMATATVDADAEYAFTPTVGLVLTDWYILVARVIGSGRLDTAGKDSDGTTSISGYTLIYGTALYPGYGIVSTYNLQQMSFLSKADGTTVEILAVKSADDS